MPVGAPTPPGRIGMCRGRSFGRLPAPTRCPPWDRGQAGGWCECTTRIRRPGPLIVVNMVGMEGPSGPQGPAGANSSDGICVTYYNANVYGSYLYYVSSIYSPTLGPGGVKSCPSGSFVSVQAQSGTGG